jgi:hypothetical protein
MDMTSRRLAPAPALAAAAALLAVALPTCRVDGEPPPGADKRAAAPPPSAAPAAPASALRRPTKWRSPAEAPATRVAEAEASKRDVVKGLFAAASVSFPPAQVFLRAFKQEGEVELWAASGAADKLSLVATYGVCAASGELGPKRKQGDLQVPEGFYTLSAYNPASHYHLAMQVSYPNLSDRILGDKRDPGSEIMIHGRCASIGCLAMSDERIQEIWLATTALRNLGGVVQVHIFPARDLAALLAAEEHREHHAFWQNLKEGLDLFEARKRLPQVRVEPDGRYKFLSL